jgi:hypothetical protein
MRCFGEFVVPEPTYSEITRPRYDAKEATGSYPDILTIRNGRDSAVKFSVLATLALSDPEAWPRGLGGANHSFSLGTDATR